MSSMKTLGTYLEENRQYVRKVGSDLLAIIPLAIGVLTLYLAGQPYKRGFNCDDESIRYPYKDNTISSTVLYFYSTLIPVITILVVEFLYHRKSVGDYIQSEGLSSQRPTYVHGLWQVYLRLAPFVFGALISQMTTDIAKYSIGRLRPHFIDLCKPEANIGGRTIYFTKDTDCPAGTGMVYITDFSCTSTEFSEDRIRDGRLSFMSGHSSFSAFCLIYLVIYLQLRVNWKVIGFVRPLYQCLLIYLVLYTGFSRISDYKHHWSDVLIGLFQGTAVAFLVTRYISDLYTKKRPSFESTALPLNRVGVEDDGTNGNPKRNPNYNSCKVELEESVSS